MPHARFPRNRSADVGDDVAEQVVGDHDVEPLGVRDEEHRRGVDVEIVGTDLGEVSSHPVERAGPQVACVREHVVLVHQSQAASRRPRCPAERVAHHTLNAECRVEALFGGHLVRGAATQHSPRAGVRPFGALAYDDHVDVSRRLARKRRGHAWVELHRAQVDVVVELEAQAQQQPALKDATGDGGVAYCAQQDGVMGADLLEHGVRQGLAGAVPALRPQVVLGALERDVVAPGNGVEHLQPFCDDLRSDAVSGDDGNPVRVQHAPRVRGRLREW